MFKKKPVPVPTSKVLVRAYDAKLAKKGLWTAALGGLDDEAVDGIIAYYQQDANVLVEHGYLPVAMAWNAGATMLKGPCLTVTFVRS